jgi:hypothetical protein
MESRPEREFGKRRPAAIPAAEAHPVKRSRHVALLLMGSLAVGGGAFALMPGGNCEPKGGGMAAPSLPQSGAGCPPRGSSSGGYWGYWGYGGWGGSPRSNLMSSDASSNRSSSGTSQSGSGEVTRGGFGGFARAFAAHFSGG